MDGWMEKQFKNSPSVHQAKKTLPLGRVAELLGVLQLPPHRYSVEPLHDCSASSASMSSYMNTFFD
jgi:hypothetical protein